MIVLPSTERLVLREMTLADRQGLSAILQDPIAMTHYEGAFSDDETDAWLDRQIARYAQSGRGLWAVTLRASGEMIGQCGVTPQRIGDAVVPEIGYLFRRDFWDHGYATEAAVACRDWAFRELGIDEIFSKVRVTNVPSMNVAIRMGMTVRHGFDVTYRGVEMRHLAFAITREQWEQTTERG